MIDFFIERMTVLGRGLVFQPVQRERERERERMGWERERESKYTLYRHTYIPTV